MKGLQYVGNPCVSIDLSYFHNGLATTLDDVVTLYQTSLGFVFTPQEAADLVAFLQAL